MPCGTARESLFFATVDFVANYSGDFVEPSVLPARLPNLLVNGSQGIAVGMATNIPPHNLGEIIDAVVHLLDHPAADTDDLLAFITGPDFPTGARILGRGAIESAYRTGRGPVKMRAAVEVVETGNRTALVATELPYQVSAGSVARKIAALVGSRQLDGIADVNDESSGDDTRFVITLKRDANPEVVLNNLWKKTPLQSSFTVNLVALVDGVPRTLTLRDALAAYVDHQRRAVRDVDAVDRGAVNETRLLGAGDDAHLDAGPLPDRGQELPAVLRLAHRAGRRRHHLVHLVRFGQTLELRQRLQRRAHRRLGQRAPAETAGAEPDHLLLAVHDLERVVRPDLHHDHVDGVRADVEGGYAHGQIKGANAARRACGGRRKVYYTRPSVPGAGIVA